MRRHVNSGLAVSFLISSNDDQLKNVWGVPYGNLCVTCTAAGQCFLIVLLAIICGQLLRAQQPSNPLPSSTDSLNRRLQELLTPVGVTVNAATAAEVTIAAQPAGAEHIRLLWRGAPPPMADGRAGVSAIDAGSLTIAGRIRRSAEDLPKRRSIDLASNRLLVVAVSSQSELKHWTTIPDPRILRSEVPRADGTLEGRIVQATDPEILISIPDDSTITEVRFYACRWSGSLFTLELLNKVSVRP